LTDVERTTPLLNVLPQTKVTGLGLGGASMEAEALDGGSGECVAAVMQSAKGSMIDPASGLSKWGHAKEVMDGWAKRLAQRLAKAR
jgi:hypothetical protein